MIIVTVLLVLFLEVSLHAAAQDKKVGCYIEMPFGGLLPYLGVGSMELQDQHINSSKSQGSQTRTRYLVTGKY